MNIKYKGKELQFSKRGEGFPVVFIHGMLMDHHRDGLYTDSLVSQGFKVIEIDVPGHGGSTYWTPKLGDLIESIKRMITRLKIKEYHCAGLSLGANLAGELALRDKRARKVVMIAPIVSKAHVYKFFAKMIAKTITEGSVSPRKFFRNTYKTNTSPEYPKDKVEKRIDEIFSQRKEAFLSGPLWESQINAGKNISKLKKRCLVISGKRDQLAPAKFAKEFSSNMKIIDVNHSDISKKDLGYGKNNLLVKFFSQ